MSRITTKASQPRRAVADTTHGDALGSPRDSLIALRNRLQQPELTPRYAEMATQAPTDDNRHTINSGLAALTVSALGLAVAGAVTMTSTAAASNPQALLEAQTKGKSAATVAEPAPARAASDLAAGADLNSLNSSDQISQGGALEGRSNSDTSRTAVRTELDAAMGVQRADERAKQLSAANDSAAEASRSKAAASRSDQLSNSTNSIAAENDRLKAAKDAAAKAQQAAQQAAQPPAGTLSAAAAKESTSSIAATGGAASPMKPGTYTVGARYGAVGSWSRYHTGQDLPAPVGTPIYAAGDGVIASPNGGGWAGTHVVIRHGDGGATLYAHLSSATVSAGQQVSAGQLIGYVGMTGRTFGPHLHWEYYPNASTVGNPYTTSNPVAWLSARGVSI